MCLHACLLLCACEGCTPAVQAGSGIVLLGCTATANVVRAVLSATLPFVSILQPHQDRTGRFPHLLCRSLPPLHFHVFSPEGTLSVCLSSLLKWGSLVLPSLVRVRCALSFRRFVCSVAACSPQCNTSSFEPDCPSVAGVSCNVVACLLACVPLCNILLLLLGGLR